MTTLDLDPLLKKGLKLLHSRSKDSIEQLKSLLDEAHRQRQGKALSNIKDPFNLRRESPIPRSKQSSPSNIGLSKGGDLKRDIPHKGREEDPLALPPKRPKLDSPHNPFKSHTPSPTPSLKSESSSRSRKSDESDSDADMNELASEIGINCTVCKSFEQTSGNQLVECQECHSLFHQECHKPSVSHQDITDPRLVWYCSKCSRNLKKQSSLVSSSSSSSLGGLRSSSVSSSTTKNLSSLSSNPSRPSPTKSIGMQRPSPFTNLSSATRSNLGSSSSSVSSSAGGSSISSSGSRSGSTLSSSSTRGSASGPPAANSLLHAERRVHLMKKKAAAKNAERRKMSVTPEIASSRPARFGSLCQRIRYALRNAGEWILEDLEGPEGTTREKGPRVMHLYRGPISEARPARKILRDISSKPHLRFYAGWTVYLDYGHGWERVNGSGVDQINRAIPAGSFYLRAENPETTPVITVRGGADESRSQATTEYPATKGAVVRRSGMKIPPNPTYPSTPRRDTGAAPAWS